MRPSGNRSAMSMTPVAVVVVIALIGIAVVAYATMPKSSSTTAAPSTSTSSSASTLSAITSLSITSHSFSIPQSGLTTTSSTQQTFSNSTGNAALAGQLKITKIVGDINSSQEQQVVYSLLLNQTSVSGNLPFVGNPGQTFWLSVSLEFAACPCVGVVTSVVSATPGFTVTGWSPALPEAFSGGGGDEYESDFMVQVTAPSTPYSGILTLIETVE